MKNIYFSIRSSRVSSYSIVAKDAKSNSVLQRTFSHNIIIIPLHTRSFLNFKMTSSEYLFTLAFHFLTHSSTSLSFVCAGVSITSYLSCIL